MKDWRSRARAYVDDLVGRFHRAKQAMWPEPPTNAAMETLTPTILTSPAAAHYEQDLVQAMADPLVRNIAITGGYGAGKSSLIQTFKANHREFRYASVSLATFRKDRQPTVSADEAVVAAQPSEVTVGELINQIEETIVQQLLYAVPAEELPRTRLKRIVQPPRMPAIVSTLLLLVGMSAAARLYLASITLPNGPSLTPLWAILDIIPALYAVVAALGIGAYLLYRVVRSLSLVSVDGWSVKGGKLESMQSSSVLHKNVDEIVYCFQRSRTNVVIIEDLDRFGIQDVFFRLREINAIINESNVAQTVRFIYALNDELFAGSEKTKFFDFILPVVPVINKENSTAKMTELLRKRAIEGLNYAERVDADLIETVCYHIDDLRLVKNIVNEFDVFARTMMSDVKLDCDKLFAMIAIKNLHSDLYWQLTKRKGCLYELIAGYPDWRADHAATVRASIAVLERMIDRKRMDAARQKDELRMLAWYHIQMRGGSKEILWLKLGYERYSFAEFLGDDVFDELTTPTSQVALINANSQHMGLINVSDVLADIDYDVRLEAINADDESLHAEIATKAAYLADLQQMPLKDGITTGYQVAIGDELAKLPLVKYLLASGHLDQDYSDYLSYFYAHAISVDDMNLLLTLRRGEACEVTASIDDPEKLLKKLRPEYIDKGRGLIAPLVNHLCVVRETGVGQRYTLLLRRILDDARDYPNRFAEVAKALLSRDKMRYVIRTVASEEPRLLGALLASDGLSDDDSRQRLVVAVFETLEVHELWRMYTADQTFRDEVAGMPRVTLIAPHLGSATGGWAWIEESQLRFGRLDRGTASDVLDMLVAHDALAPTLSMLRLVAAPVTTANQANDLVTIQRLRDGAPSTMDAFLTRHIDAVMEHLLAQPGYLAESTEAALWAINEVSTMDLAADYFERTTCSFATLDVLYNALWSSALKGDRVDDRVLAVWMFADHLQQVAEGLDDTVDADRQVLIDYLVRHAGSLSGELWVDLKNHAQMKEWLISEARLPDTTMTLLLAGTMVDDPSIITERVTDSRLLALACAAALTISERMWAALADRSAAVKAAYLSSQWGRLTGTAIEASMPLDVAFLLYRDGVLSRQDAVRVFGRFEHAAFAASPDAVVVMGKLAAEACAANEPFPPTLVQTAAHIAAMSGLDRQTAAHLLAQGMPALGWPAVMELLQRFDDDMARLQPHRNFEVDRTSARDSILRAMDSRKWFSSLTWNETTVRGRVKKVPS
ncbi:thymidylate kinase [Luteibacter sp. 1214]|uniref:YobI family P-loop NTPase n=1 Tax=Luteibacter sp. 1214 TaxID=2817735 RepID=UPI002862B722|nr:P-loop NTPase fold protein [Luteibacter sp. 1214]MDR6641174.1 thymidylate kinase [Luteibacter sp. 1214]